MNKRIDFTKLGVLYMYQTSFGFMQDAYGNALAALANGLGDKWVLKGCVDNGTTVTDGVIMVGDDMIPFTGGTKAGNTYVKITTSVTKALYDDGNLKDCYYVKTAALVAIGDFAYTDLKRLPSGGIMKNISDLQTVVKRAINFEDTVILKGGLVTDVDTGASTCDISAGTAYFDGVLIEFAAQTDITYPCYLLPSGSFSNSVPGSGLYVRFNPYTSQYYKDVLKRAVTGAGEIKMFETLSDRFDGSGVGRWEMTGFSLLASMQNRVPVGLWFDGVAESNVSDAAHEDAGYQGGEKEHELTEAELAEHDHLNGVADDKAAGDAQSVFVYGTVTTGMAGSAHGNVANGSGGSVYQGLTSLEGGGDSHNNMQPYTVVVYAKRTT